MGVNKLVESPVAKFFAAVALAGAAAYSAYHQDGVQAERRSQEIGLVRKDIEKTLTDRIEHTNTKPFPPGLLHFERDRLQSERRETVRSYEKLLSAHQRGISREEFKKELQNED